MKKVLVALVVLGILSSANAAYEITCEGGSIDGWKLGVVSDNAKSWLGYIIVDEGDMGILSNPTVYNTAGDLGEAIPYSEDGWGTGYELNVGASSTGMPVSAGLQFTLDFIGSFLGDKVLLYIDPYYDKPADSFYSGICEPRMPLGLYVNGEPTGPTVDIPEGQEVEITFGRDIIASWLGYVIIEEGGLGELRLVDGDNGIIPYDDWGKVVEIGPDSVVKYSYIGDVIANPTFISLYIDPEYENPADRFQVIPEPASLILLCTGGLFLLQRKIAQPKNKIYSQHKDK